MDSKTKQFPAVLYDFVLKDEPIRSLGLEHNLFCSPQRMNNRNRCNVFYPNSLSPYHQVNVNEIGMHVLLEEKRGEASPSIEAVSDSLQMNLCLRLYREDMPNLETHFIAGTDSPLSEEYYLSEYGVSPINQIPLIQDPVRNRVNNRTVRMRSHIDIHECPITFVPRQNMAIILSYTGDLAKIHSDFINATIVVYIRGMFERETTNG